MTIPEVAIAIVILGITASGLLASIGMAHRIARHLTNRSTVLNIIQAQIEEIRGELRTGGFTGVGSTSHPDITRTISSSDSGSLTATISTSIRAMGLDPDTGALTDVGFSDPNRILFLEVTVTGSWDLLGDAFDETETITTYMTLL